MLDGSDTFQVGRPGRLIGASRLDPRRVINAGKASVTCGEKELAPGESACIDGATQVSCLTESTLIVEHIGSMPQEEKPKKKTTAKKPAPKKPAKKAPKKKAKK